MPHAATPDQVVAFWLNAGRKAWFAKSDAFDREIRERFLELHYAAAYGDLDGWRDTPDGALALLLLLDQFPRNMFRGAAEAFATDARAREVARAAIASGFDKTFPADLRAFFYLPFEHAEDLALQDQGVKLCEALAAETADVWTADALKWARIHRDIVARFGRFPHRNACLGRATTPEEQMFLDSGGFRG
ncbi:MAG: DUF924 family protein [Caulobacteraceae bacterium]